MNLVKRFCPEMSKMLQKHGFHLHVFIHFDLDTVEDGIGIMPPCKVTFDYILDGDPAMDRIKVQAGKLLLFYLFSGKKTPEVTVEYNQEYLVKIKGVRFDGPWLN